MILNGSPRAPRSNSRRYAEIFTRYCTEDADYFCVSRTNHVELSSRMEAYSDLLLVFPLYADSLPVGLLDFLKSLERNPPRKKPVVSVLINCGFLEHRQNDVAIKMIRLFCARNGYQVGSVLSLGSGEAILGSPFRWLAVWGIRKLARSVARHDYRQFHVTMPIPKKLFLIAATRYWVAYGKRFGVSQERMRTLDIE